MADRTDSRTAGRHLQVAPPAPQTAPPVSEPVTLEEVAADLAESNRKMDAFLAGYPAAVRAAVIDGMYTDADGELRTTFGMLADVDAAPVEVTETDDVDANAFLDDEY